MAKCDLSAEPYEYEFDGPEAERLEEIAYQLTRIADSLEKMEDK